MIPSQLYLVGLAFLICTSMSPAAATTAASTAQEPANKPLVTDVRRLPRWYEKRWITSADNQEEARKEQANTNCAAVGDTIEIQVVNLDNFLTSTPDKRHWPRELVPYLDGIPLPKTYPCGVTHDHTDPARPLTRLVYLLDYPQDTKENWVKLLRGSARDIEVTVGLESGQRVSTQVQSFRLVRVLVQLIVPAFVGVVLILLVFLFLAKRTDIIRDPSAPRRPDNTRPYSLGRSQMAFWFFIIVASFLFLLIATGGSTQTLNPQVLVLMGISASAGFGALVADRINPDTADPGENVPAVNLNQPRAKIVLALRAQQAQQAQLQREMELKQAAQGAVGDEAARKHNADEIASLTQAIKRIDTQVAYFEVPAWRAVFIDLLTEHGSVSFHRFQMAGWTVILGVIFVIQVVADYAMPAFDATLLGLMGIVGTTYVGFKFPTPQATSSTSAHTAGGAARTPGT